jgi:glycosyltransferase involved in cell wall biosynthesis
MTPIISVVLPTHNGSRFIDQAIESVVTQTFTDWELILVDDASTDDTPSKLAFWAALDTRIRVITFDQNRKLPGALNEGFKQACGQFYTWTSDDNWYHPTAFERMLEILKQKMEIDIVYTKIDLVDAGDNSSESPFVKSVEYLPFHNCVGACFLFRRMVFEQLGGYQERLFLAEDYDFWLRASNKFTFRMSQEILYSYRLEGGLSQRQDEVTTATELTLEQWLPTATRISREARGRAYLNIANSAFNRHAFLLGRRRLLKAVIVLRNPLLLSGYRSFLLDLIFGSAAGKFWRKLKVILTTL